MDFVTLVALDCASIASGSYAAFFPILAGVVFVAVHNFARDVGVKGGR